MRCEVKVYSLRTSYCDEIYPAPPLTWISVADFSSGEMLQTSQRSSFRVNTKRTSKYKQCTMHTNYTFEQKSSAHNSGVIWITTVEPIGLLVLCLKCKKRLNQDSHFGGFFFSINIF